MADWKSEAFVVLLLCSKCKLAMHQLVVKRDGGGGRVLENRSSPWTSRTHNYYAATPVDRRTDSPTCYIRFTLCPRFIPAVASSPPSRANRRVSRAPRNDKIWATTTAARRATDPSTTAAPAPAPTTTALKTKLHFRFRFQRRINAKRTV